MHEMSIMMEIIRIVDDMAVQNDIKHVNEIVLDVGELSGVVPEYMTEYFPIIVADMPLYQGTSLKMITIPGRAICDKCHTGFNVIEHEGHCPKCGAFEKTVISGEEFSIREIVVPEVEGQ